MKPRESVTDFYQRMPDHAPTHVPLDNAGTGHFNVFSRETCSLVSPYSRRDFYKVSLIIGTGTIYYADQWVKIDRPTLLFSNPIVPYAWEADSPQQAGWYCLFTEAFVQPSERLSSLRDSPLFKIGTHPVFFLTEDQAANINGIFMKMSLEMASTYTHKFDVLRSYLHLLIHEAMKTRLADSFQPYTNAATRVAALFLELLERQYPIDSPAHGLKLTSPVDYAHALSLHVNHLNRSVKEVTGRTTTDHLADRVIREARALLLHTDWSIADIAYSLGFAYPSYFTLFFKKHTGMAPTQLRSPAR